MLDAVAKIRGSGCVGSYERRYNSHEVGGRGIDV
jgi:hypothetical protein